MFARCAKRFTTYFVKNGIILEDDKEIYEYGFEVIISSIFSIVLSMIIGIIANRFIDTIVFLLIYCSLRREAGGFHASTHFRCTISFVFILCLTLYITSISEVLEVVINFAPLLVVCFIVFLIFSPVENGEVKFNRKVKNHMKYRANALLIFYELIIFYCLFIEGTFQKYAFMGSMAIYWETVLIVFGVLQNLCWRREEDEEGNK